MLHLFGDESVFKTAAVYAFVGVAPDQQRAVEDAFTEVKSNFGGNADSHVHCRELFAGDARKKTVWKDLNPEDIYAMCRMLGIYLRSAGATFHLGMIDSREIGEYMRGADPHQPVMKVDPKHLTALAYLLPITALYEEHGMENLKIWADPDTTRINWFGKKMQAGNIGGFTEGGAVQRQPIQGSKPRLLDAADVLAYCAAHALCETEINKSTSTFKGIYSAFQPDLRRMYHRPEAPWR